MKFDVFSWNEVKPNEKIQAPKGWLRVRSSVPAPLYIEAEGFEALAGVSSSFDLEISEAATFRLDAPPGVRVFYHRTSGTTYEHSGEVFTNIDRMPDESGTVLEVRRALRELEIQRRSVLAEIRAERRAAQFTPAPAPLEPALRLEPALAPAPVAEE